MNVSPAENEPVNSITRDEEAIFHVARKILKGEARDAYLDQVCGDEHGLRELLDALLRVYEQERGFLEAPAVGAAIAHGTARSAEGPGAVIGPYTLLEELGEGGMGVVFMAEQTQPMRRRVAVKVIKPGMDSRQVIARFEAERQ